MSERVTFTKIVPDGKALGYLDGRACFVIGPLPGETAEVEVVKAKKSFAEARLLEVVERSARRDDAAEAHFIACSPWQGVDYEYQLALKQAMLEECFGRPELGLEVTEVVAAPKALGYRNKLEFAVTAGASGRVELGMHARGSRTVLVPAPDGCVLGTPVMNAAAQELLGRVEAAGLGEVAQSLVIRQSQTDGAMIGVVQVRAASRAKAKALAGTSLAGVVVTRMLPGGRSEMVWQTGRMELEETVSGVAMHYPYDGFFQVNLPAFEQALARIVEAVPEGSRVVDLYGGAGSIGLAVAAKAARVTGVEISASSVELANANARRNGLHNYEALAVAAERLPGTVLDGVDCVIVDPPRAGLARTVVDELLEAAPKRIVYLSCDPVTQARDVMYLSEKYQSGAVTGFDFYPGTLHVESLVVLDRR